MIEQRGCEAILHVLVGGDVDDDRKGAIFGLMALHLLRSSEFMGRFLMMIGDKATELYDEVAIGEEYQHVLMETGMTLEEAQETVDAAIRSPGGFFQRLRVHFAKHLSRWLSQVVKELSDGGLLLRKADTDALVLGDGPAFLSLAGCLNCETTVMFGMLDQIHRCPLHQEVSAYWPLADWQCMMPLAPTLLAVVGPRIKDANTPLPLVGSMSDKVNVMQCRRAQFRIVIPQGGQSRYLPLVNSHASFNPPVSHYRPLQPPENAQWSV